MGWKAGVAPFSPQECGCGHQFRPHSGRNQEPNLRSQGRSGESERRGRSRPLGPQVSESRSRGWDRQIFILLFRPTMLTESHASQLALGKKRRLYSFTDDGIHGALNSYDKVYLLILLSGFCNAVFQVQIKQTGNAQKVPGHHFITTVA